MGNLILKMESTTVSTCCIALVVIIVLQAAAVSTEPHDDAIDDRLNRFHSCLHQAESANHCMHLRPAELDDHVDDDDLGEMGITDDDYDDDYEIGEGLSSEEQ